MIVQVFSASSSHQLAGVGFSIQPQRVSAACAIAAMARAAVMTAAAIWYFIDFSSSPDFNC
jgi:hypothetical protein